MTKPQFTPGPWHRSPNGDYITDNNNCYVVQVTGASELAKPIAHANARLIAAAPELLEVLERLIERIDINGGLGEYKGGKAFILDDARNIIRKAKGE